MSELNTATLSTLMDNKEFVIEMLSQETPEDVQALFQRNGVDFTIEEIHELGRELDRLSSSSDELNEEILETVSGGVVLTAATCWAAAKAIFAVGSAAVAVYKWYKSR